MKLEDVDSLKFGLNYLFMLKTKSETQKIKEYLYHSDSTIRIKSVAILKSTLTNGKLESILNEYQGSKNSYYDVVTWLDRLVYTKGKILKLYCQDLESNIKTTLILVD